MRVQNPNLASFCTIPYFIIKLQLHVTRGEAVKYHTTDAADWLTLFQLEAILWQLLSTTLCIREGGDFLPLMVFFHQEEITTGAEQCHRKGSRS